MADMSKKKFLRSFGTDQHWWYLHRQPSGAPILKMRQGSPVVLATPPASPQMRFTPTGAGGGVNGVARPIGGGRHGQLVVKILMC